MLNSLLEGLSNTDSLLVL